MVASMTFTRDDLTLLGDLPVKAALSVHEFGADLIGVNCSGGPAQILRILKQMRQAVPDGRFSVMPNAGWPEQVGGRIMYPANPAYFGEYARAFCEVGASLIGGCCGTTPAHIAAMRLALDKTPEGCSDLTEEGERSRSSKIALRQRINLRGWPRSWQPKNSSLPLKWTRREAYRPTNCWQEPVS